MRVTRGGNGRCSRMEENVNGGCSHSSSYHCGAQGPAIDISKWQKHKLTYFVN